MAKAKTSPGNGPERRLTLADVMGGNQALVDAIVGNGQIVFHATGDCGSTRGAGARNEVTDWRMVGDFEESKALEAPQFSLLLGDIAHPFGTAGCCYDQFYQPYRNYLAPALDAAGIHGGMISAPVHAAGVDAHLRDTWADPAAGFSVTAEAGGPSRAALSPPGVFFTFEAPFVRILCFYGNTPEDPGVIADSCIGASQLEFLKAALQRVKQEDYGGALLFAQHPPPYVIGGQGASSLQMRLQVDEACRGAGVWPHAVLSGHAHSYQRFTRHRDDATNIPYIVCGNGGHNVQEPVGQKGITLRTPQVLQVKTADDDAVILENYQGSNYGYLRLIADSQQLRIEYHPAGDTIRVKAPEDGVTVDLPSRRQSVYGPSDCGHPSTARQVAERRNREEAQRNRQGLAARRAIRKRRTR